MCRYEDLGFTVGCEFVSSLPGADTQNISFVGEITYRKKRICGDVLFYRYGWSGDLISYGTVSSTTVESARKLAARYGRKPIVTVHPTRPIVISTIPLTIPTAGQFLFGVLPERFLAAQYGNFDKWCYYTGTDTDSLKGFRRWETLRKQGLELLEGIPKTVRTKVQSLLNNGATS